MSAAMDDSDRDNSSENESSVADSVDTETQPGEVPTQLLVAIAPDEEPDYAEQVLRAGRRFAGALGTKWAVVCVETPVILGVRGPGRDSRAEVFRLAESLGAETVTLQASSASEALMQYAELSGAGTVVLGAARRRVRLGRGSATVPAQLLREGIDADVIIVPRDPPGKTAGLEAGDSLPWPQSNRWTPYIAAVGLTGLCTALALPMLDHFDLIDMVMVYMLGATIAALRLGRGPAILCALTNIAAFDYLFIPPRFSFWVSDPHYAVTFGVMLAVASIIASLVAAVRQQTVAAIKRERRTAVLYAMTSEFAVTRNAAVMASVAERHIGDVTQGRAVVLMRDEDGKLREFRGAGHGSRINVNMQVSAWVFEHQQRAGLGSDHHPAERAMYLPLLGSQDAQGVLVVTPQDRRYALLPDQRRLLETLASQLALALERVHLVEVVQAARLAAERAALRNTLLASISHDLRTPLSAIAGAGSMMAHEDFPLDLHRRTTLGRLIEDKARDMTELLSNVLELMRLETAASVVKGDWHALEDMVGQMLRQMESRLEGRQIRTDIPSDTPVVFVEARLIVQMLNNLVENCIKYTPPQTVITVAASTTEDAVIVSVEDNGPGFPLQNPERLFDKFERGRVEDNKGGVGLGLAICRAIARLHRGDIRGLRGAGGGARVEVSLPRTPWRSTDTMVAS
jgi:two-component system, OmpR family, sensor histidine kinase KdpD